MTHIEYLDALGRFDEMMGRVALGENFAITREDKLVCYVARPDFEVPDGPPSPAAIR